MPLQPTPRWLLAIAVVCACSVFAQKRVAVAVPIKPPSVPVGKPEPARRIAVDPASAFNDLFSPSLETRQRAFHQLGITSRDHTTEPSELDDGRMYRVNIDDDKDLEVVLLLDLGFSEGTRVLVFDRSQSQWRCIGEFTEWYMWDSGKAEAMLSLREIVDYGTKDLLIRTSGGGTDIAIARDLDIYRMFNGRLYKVFSCNEEFEHRIIGGPGSGSFVNERHTLHFAEKTESGGIYIVDEQTRTRLPDAPLLTRARIAATAHAVGCSAYRWDAVKFMFVVDQSAYATYCDPVTRRPRP